MTLKGRCLDRDRAAALWFFVLFAGLYLLTMGGRTYSTDDIARYDTVVAIVEHQSLEIPYTHSASHATNEGRVYSKYGIGKPLLIIPLYLLGRTLERSGAAPGWLTAPMVASTLDQWLAAGVVAVLFVVGRLHGYRPRTAAVIALTCGAATMLLPLSKFAFEHPLVTLLLLAAFAALLPAGGARGPKESAFAGVCLGAVLLTRPSDFLFAGAPLGLYFAFSLQRAARPWRCVAAFSVPIFLAGIGVLFYNYVRFDDFFESGYDDVDYDLRFLPVGLTGLLASTGKSVFLWNPPLVASLAAFGVYAARHRAEARLTLGLAAAYLGGIGSLNFWHGDWCVGPRYLLPVIPFLLLPIGQALEEPQSRRRVRWFLALTLPVGALVALVGCAVDYGLYCGRFAYDLDRARFVPQSSPLIVYWEYIRNGQVTFFWYEVLRATNAPSWLKAMILVPAAAVVGGAAGVLRATHDRPKALPRPLRPGPPLRLLRLAPLVTRRQGRRALAALVLLASLVLILTLPRRLPPRANTEHGLTGRYFAGEGWRGQAVLTRLDSRLDFTWSKGTRPAPSAFSAEWTGSVVVPRAGHYKFFLRSDDGSWLFIDDRLIVDNGGVHGVRQISESVYLEIGPHPIRLLYFDSGFGEAKLRLAWKREGGRRNPVLGGAALLPRPYRSVEEQSYAHALRLHAAGDRSAAIAAYKALLGPTELGVAARAQRARALAGRPPLVPGLRAMASPGGLVPPFARDPESGAGDDFGIADAPGHDSLQNYQGVLLVPDGGIQRLGITANTSMSVSCAGLSLAVKGAGIDEHGGPLAAGFHPLSVTLVHHPGVVQAEIWWQRPGEEPEPVPKAFLISESSSVTEGRPEPEELAYLLLEAARENEACGRQGAAAAYLRRLVAAGDSLAVQESLGRLVAGGVRATYYATADWSGPPLITRVDPNFDFDWSRRRIVAGPMSVVWDTQLDVVLPGAYRFELESDDGAWLHIDDRLVVDNGGVHSRLIKAGEVELARGIHPLRITYFDSGFGEALLRLFWKPPEAATSRLVPRDRLILPPDRTPAPAPTPTGSARPILRFSFDCGAYFDWIASGDAFGPRPVAAAIGTQNPVVNPAGGAFVDSYWRASDFYQGELRSRPFVITGRRLSFWIGGGCDEEHLYLGLEVDGQIVRRATGQDSEVMHREEWDIGDYLGRTACLVIADRSSGHWGHILVDDIILSR